jgi:hypothetical protein
MLVAIEYEYQCLHITCQVKYYSVYSCCHKLLTHLMQCYVYQIEPANEKADKNTEEYTKYK